MTTKEKPCNSCGTAIQFETGFRTGRHPSYCPPCKAEHEREANRRKSQTWRARHPEANRAAQVRWHAERVLSDPAFLAGKRTRETMRRHGLSQEQMDEWVSSQGGVCAICGGLPGKIGRSTSPGRLHIDHCHSTGKIRGLLCGRCNTMLGLAKDDPDILVRAINYLAKAKE